VRLFIAVELGDQVRRAAADAAGRLRERLERAAPALIARWIPPENFHITLRFIGEATDERAREIVTVLGPSFHTPAFQLELHGCGVFPTSGPPRVLWIGTTGGRSSMAALHGEVQERLAPLGLLPERRPYAAHLTIARVKDAGRGQSAAIRQTAAGLAADCGATAVNAVTLFRSRLSSRGAAYEPVLRVPLG